VTVTQGKSNGEIAAELHISLSTVMFHIASLMSKIGAPNRVEIAIWAYETSRVRPSPFGNRGRLLVDGAGARWREREFIVA
jgi:hypothetical protein